MQEFSLAFALARGRADPYLHMCLHTYLRMYANSENLLRTHYQ